MHLIEQKVWGEGEFDSMVGTFQRHRTAATIQWDVADKIGVMRELCIISYTAEA